MSLQTYNKFIFLDDREVVSGQAAPALTKRGLAMEFQADIMVSKGKDKLQKRSTVYTIVGDPGEGGGSDETANEQIGNMIDAGSRMASNIAYLSKGVLCGFFAKMGKYRPDEVPLDVPTGDNSSAIIDLTNNPNDSYGLDACDRENTNPVQSVGSRLYIPWLRDDISRQDIVNTLENWSYTAGGLTFYLGHVKFYNDNKVEMVCYPTTSVRNINVRAYSRKSPGYLANNDSAQGILSDRVLSEKYNTFEDGDDDPDDTHEPNP